MDIVFKMDVIPTPEQVCTLYERSAMPRPTTDKERIHKMFCNSNIITTAWDNDNLVGVCRGITDWVWCCYLSDLVVDPGYKRAGIGKRLIELTKARVGQQAMILLLSVPTAMEYYPKVGFTKEDRAFMINRAK